MTEFLDRPHMKCYGLLMLMKMIKSAMIILVLLVLPHSVNAVEKAERISDREIIESLAELKAGQKAMERRIDSLEKSIDKRFESVDKRFDDLNNLVNKRFDDVTGLLQLLAGAMLVVGGGILGWLVVIWRKLIVVEERQKRFETQDDEIKFLKEAYNRLNEMVIKLMDALKAPRGVL